MPTNRVTDAEAEKLPSLASLMAAASRRGDETSMRQVLRYLAVLRAQQDYQRRALAADIRAAIEKASQAGISRTEIADLLGIDRSGLYRTYLWRDTEAAG